ncbi:MAG: hypothetical protein ACJAUP_002833 [Cellvibrionaceae bacterium]|jgi:hypothetical protein
MAPHWLQLCRALGIEITRSFFKKLSAGILIVLAVMSIVASFGLGDPDFPIDFIERLLFIPWCIGIPVIFTAFFYFRKSNIFEFISAGGFIGSATSVFPILVITVFSFMLNGPLYETAMIFVFIPFLQIKFSIIGSIVGVGIYFVKKRIKKPNKKIKPT